MTQHRDDADSLADLLAVYDTWWEQEDQPSQAEWTAKGMELCRAILQLDPENITYRTNYAKLLLDVGREEKMRHLNHQKARVLFDEVLQIDAANAYAHYHLGWLDCFDHAWKTAIAHFQQALSSRGLTVQTRIRSFANMALAYSRLGNDRKANEYFERAKREDSRAELATELDYLAISLSAPVPVRYQGDYLIITSNGKKIAPRSAVDEAVFTSQEDFILNRIDGYIRCPGNHVEWDIENKSGELIEYLLTHSGINRKSVIRRELWPGKELGVVKTNISRVRNHVADCMGIDLETVKQDIIVTVGDGYKWKRGMPFLIVRPLIVAN